MRSPEASPLSESELRSAVREGYFGALDQGDIDATVDCFAADAVLTCVGQGGPLHGREEIRAFFEEIVGESLGMTHEVLLEIVDEPRQRVATELRYVDRLTDGRSYDMRNVNLFEFDGDGRFSRVTFWLGASL